MNNIVFIVFFCATVVLIIQPEWASVLFRVSSSTFDGELWRGMLESTPMACNCSFPSQRTVMMMDERSKLMTGGVTANAPSATGGRGSGGATADIDDEDGGNGNNDDEEEQEQDEAAPMFVFKPLSEVEIMRRRFCFVVTMRLPCVQVLIVDAVRWLASKRRQYFPSSTEDSHPQQLQGFPSSPTCYLGSDDTKITDTSETGTETADDSSIVVMKKWFAEQQEAVDAAAEKKASTTNKKPTSARLGAVTHFSYKVYDATFRFQLAPPVVVAASQQQLSASAQNNPFYLQQQQRSNNINKRRGAMLSEHTFIANASSTAPKLPVFEKVLAECNRAANNNTHEQQGAVVGMRVASLARDCFGRRGFPSWNILPSEPLILDIRVHRD